MLEYRKLPNLAVRIIAKVLAEATFVEHEELDFRFLEEAKEVFQEQYPPEDSDRFQGPFSSNLRRAFKPVPVSYTHLTLPTIYSM